MRIIRFVDENGQIHWGSDHGDGRADYLEGDIYQDVKNVGGVGRVIRRLAPVEPKNIYCVGLNYRRHAMEFDLPVPEHPVIFMKPTSSVIGPDDEIRLPACCVHGPEVDFEAELAVVIGRPGSDIKPGNALEHVLGYMCANDVSARWWQKHTGGQWVRGKSFNTFCPLGPVMVTSDEIGDPQMLAISSVLNGELMQSGHTSDMIFSVSELIAFLSRDTTLEAGTLILTGTPPGVGFARKPPVFMKSGDRIRIELEKVGVLENGVR